MADKIRLLPDSVSNQIAAGEVVNRPSSVVKEMLENAVDAGSSSITVNFHNGGKDLIQIIDNGCGMSPVDARLAFDKHATSKINSVDDIYHLSTFGFRGEALASIASIAEVELRTRQAQSELGCKVEISGGKYISTSSVSCPVGSQFIIRNLFYNVPARKRFLDKSSTESRHIIAEYQRIALCNWRVAFSLYDSDTLISSLEATSSLRSRIVGVIGKNIATNLIELSADTSVVRVEGFVGRPAGCKQNNKEQFLFVNGRYFKSLYFHKAVIAAYEKLIPSNTQPSYFIYLTLDPERIDVNVHPQKTDVKFEDGSVMWQIINAAVRESLAKSGAVPSMDFDIDTSVEIPVFKPSTTVYTTPQIKGNPDFNPFDKYDMPNKEGVADFSRNYNTSASVCANVSEEAAQMEYIEFESEDNYRESMMEFIEGSDSVQGELDLSSDVTVGEVIPVSGRYAATVIAGELVVIDICRAHESVLYDRYMVMLSSESSVTQQLLFTQQMILSIDDYDTLCEHLDEFKSLGFDIDFMDDHTIEITGTPADFSLGEMSDLIYELLDVVREQTHSAGEIKKARMAAIMARANALSVVKESTAQELSALVGALLSSTNPSYTPMGLPIMSVLSQREIQKRLK